jgi:hypothetical protein
MFKAGDKVVCISINNIIDKNGIIRHQVRKLKEHEIYTISNNDGGSDDVELAELSNIFYQQNRFILLSEYRKMKMEKIQNRMND